MQGVNGAVSSKVAVGKSIIHGKGLFAQERILKGEAVVDFSRAGGEILSEEAAAAYFARGNDYSIQIADDKFFVLTDTSTLAEEDFSNHSCDPNCGFRGALLVVAMHDIEKGEDLTFDYAMVESSSFYGLNCHCGSKLCRGVVRGSDWLDPVLQKRYKGYFAEYLEKKIK